METGIPILKQGFTKGCVYPRFHMVIAVWKRGVVSLDSPYGNRDHHMETGIRVSIWCSPFPCCDSVMEINYAQNGHVNCFLLHKFLLQWWKTHPTPYLTISCAYFCKSCYSCGNASCIAYLLSCMNTPLWCRFPCTCSVSFPVPQRTIYNELPPSLWFSGVTSSLHKPNASSLHQDCSMLLGQASRHGTHRHA